MRLPPTTFIKVYFKSLLNFSLSQVFFMKSLLVEKILATERLGEKGFFEAQRTVWTVRRHLC